MGAKLRDRGSQRARRTRQGKRSRLTGGRFQRPTATPTTSWPPVSYHAGRRFRRNRRFGSRSKATPAKFALEGRPRGRLASWPRGCRRLEEQILHRSLRRGVRARRRSAFSLEPRRLRLVQRSAQGPSGARLPANTPSARVTASASRCYEQRTACRSPGKSAVTAGSPCRSSARSCGGKRPAASAKSFEIKFKEFIVSPRVTVNVEMSQPVTVTMMGEVAKAGELKKWRRPRASSGLGQAGGPSSTPNRSRIFVLRRFPDYRRIRFTWDSLVHNEKGAALFALRSGDIVSSSSSPGVGRRCVPPAV